MHLLTMNIALTLLLNKQKKKKKNLFRIFTFTIGNRFSGSRLNQKPQQKKNF